MTIELWKSDALSKCLQKHDIKEPRCGASCGPGWVPLIDTLITKLITMGWDKNLQQIKEKFGALRFYIGGGTPEMHDMIHAYEAMTETMCEECGSKGEARSWNKFWVKCLCPAHGEEYSSGS